MKDIINFDIEMTYPTLSNLDESDIQYRCELIQCFHYDKPHEYDFEIMSQRATDICRRLKSYPWIQEWFVKEAGQLLSEDPEVGCMMLFRYHTFHLFYSFLKDFYELKKEEKEQLQSISSISELHSLFQNSSSSSIPSWYSTFTMILS